MQKQTLLAAREQPIKIKRPTRRDGTPQYFIKIYSRFWENKPKDTTLEGIVEGDYIWVSEAIPDNAEPPSGLSNATTFFNSFQRRGR